VGAMATQDGFERFLAIVADRNLVTTGMEKFT
jgi:hypothetical protein